MVWLYTIISVIIVSLISLVGLITLSFSERFLKKTVLLLVSFSAGALLGNTFINLIPEAIAENGFTINISLLILGGIIIFFILEQFVFWHHCHQNVSGKCHPFTYMILVGDGFHNFIDGGIVAASYLVDIKLGIITTISIILHEIPQEISDFGVLIHGGFSKKKAILMNLLSAFSAIIGAVLVLIIGSKLENITQSLLPITAGGFIYIATADLIPELHKERKGFWSAVRVLSFFILGIIAMMLLLLIE